VLSGFGNGTPMSVLLRIELKCSVWY